MQTKIAIRNGIYCASIDRGAGANWHIVIWRDKSGMVAYWTIEGKDRAIDAALEWMDRAVTFGMPRL